MNLTIKYSIVWRNYFITMMKDDQTGLNNFYPNNGLTHTGRGSSRPEYVTIITICIITFWS